MKNDATNRDRTLHHWHDNAHSCVLGIAKTPLHTSVHLLITPEESNFMVPSSQITEKSSNFSEVTQLQCDWVAFALSAGSNLSA